MHTCEAKKTKQGRAGGPPQRQWPSHIVVLGILAGAAALGACGGPQEGVSHLAQASSSPPPPSLAKILAYGYVPRIAHGTLAAECAQQPCQQPVNIPTVAQGAQGILGSVGSAPLITVGPNCGVNADGTVACSNPPITATTTCPNTSPTTYVPGGYVGPAGQIMSIYFTIRGYFHLRATNVTSPGMVTLDLRQKNLGTSTFESFGGSSGISMPSVYVAVNPNQADYFIPIELANAGECGQAVFGTFDVFVSQTGITANTLQVLSGGLQVMAWPTNTAMIAGTPQILDFVATGNESELLWNVAGSAL